MRSLHQVVEPQISPLRFASVETTNLWQKDAFSLVKAQSRLKFVISTEAKRSGEICGFLLFSSHADPEARTLYKTFTFRAVTSYGCRVELEISSVSINGTGIMPSLLKRSIKSRSTKGFPAKSCWWAYSVMSSSNSSLPVT